MSEGIVSGQVSYMLSTFDQYESHNQRRNNIRRQPGANLATSTGGVLIRELDSRGCAAIRNTRVILLLCLNDRLHDLAKIARATARSIIRRWPERDRLGGNRTFDEVLCYQFVVFARVCLRKRSDKAHEDSNLSSYLIPA
jgi:hypothetical protein